MKINKRQQAFLNTYKENRAVLYDSLVAAKVRKSEYDKWRENNPDFNEECEMVELYAVSIVENRVMDIVQNPNLIDSKLLTWYLERKGIGYDKPKEQKDKVKDDYKVVFGK